MTRCTITLTVTHEDGTFTDHQLPAKWEICHSCQGNGTSSAYLGAFTREDMDEMGDEFMEDYMRGAYDRACDECGGSGKVRVVDEERCPPELLKELRDQEEAEAEYQAMVAAERRMGC
jgi:hypothetical protein